LLAPAIIHDTQFQTIGVSANAMKYLFRLLFLLSLILGAISSIITLLAVTDLCGVIFWGREVFSPPVDRTPLLYSILLPLLTVYMTYLFIYRLPKYIYRRMLKLT